MANIRYPHIINRQLLINLLITSKMSLAQAAKMLGVPYNSLRHQVLKLLTADELKQVTFNRERVTHSRREKLAILKEARATTMRKAAANHGLHFSMLYTWRKTFAKEYFARREAATMRTSGRTSRGRIA